MSESESHISIISKFPKEINIINVHIINKVHIRPCMSLCVCVRVPVCAQVYGKGSMAEALHSVASLAEVRTPALSRTNAILSSPNTSALTVRDRPMAMGWNACS